MITPETKITITELLKLWDRCRMESRNEPSFSDFMEWLSSKYERYTNNG